MRTPAPRETLTPTPLPVRGERGFAIASRPRDTTPFSLRTGRRAGDEGRLGRCKLKKSVETWAMDYQRPKHRYNVSAARELRARQTPAEAILWGALRNRRPAGLRFRRQHPIGPFVVDFCCPDQRLAIELDGAIHAHQRDRDVEREELLTTAGYRLIRFPNHAVLHDLPTILESVLAAAHEPIRPSQRVSRTTGW